MALKGEDFEKLPSIIKKKVLINMTGLRQTILSDPNTLVQETRHSNLKTLVTFARDNWHFLNPESKGLLAD